MLYALAVFAALPALLLPLYNPDLFWHLAAGDWIRAHRQLPVTDVLASGRAPMPWLDFEWLSQVVFSRVYALAGMAGLRVLKMTLMGASWFPLDRVLAANRVPRPGRALGLALFFLIVLGFSDIRPELFSILFFTGVLFALERYRLSQVRRPALVLLSLAALFALWADFHAGFFFGLALIGCYAAAEAVERRWRRAGGLCAALIVCAAATAANPYGLGPHRVAFEHLGLGAQLSRTIAEWRPMSDANPLHWPFWVALAALTLLIVLWFLQEKRPASPLGLALATGLFGAQALAHTRMGLFFAAPAALLMVLLARDLGLLEPELALGACAAAAAFALWLVPQVRWTLSFNDKFVPVGAARFLGAQRPVFEPLHPLDQWEWGGFLEWRLPWLKVYVDGRYLFHDELPKLQDAAASAASWQAMLEAKGFDAALVPDLPLVFPTVKAYRDGSRKTFLRPWYLFYMPRERWALVYWDDQALVFVDRRAVPADWLGQHEYRWLLPKDDTAFLDAERQGEIPPAALRAERARHITEAPLAP